MAEKAVVTLSGGLDSAVALALAKNKFEMVRAYFVNYGQKSGRMELGMALHLARHYKVDLEVIQFPVIDSPLTNEHLPEGALAQGEDQDPNTVTPLYVPMRNLLIVAHVASRAYGLGVYTIVTGNTPSKSYPDTGSHYIWELKNILDLSSWKDWSIYAPLVAMSKSSIVTLGSNLNVPFHLTWSCLVSRTADPCGACRSCLKRAEAFKKAGIKDPIVEGKKNAA